MKKIWHHYPVLFALPFLLATLNIPAIADVASIARWVVLALGVVFAWKYRFRRSGFAHTSMSMADAIVIVAVGCFFLSALWSIDPSNTIQRTFSVSVLYISTFWALWIYADQFSAEALIDKLVITVAIVFALNLVLGWYMAEPLFAGRYRGLFVNPNNIGLISSVAVPLAIQRFLVAPSFKSVLIVTILLGNLALSGSRSAAIAVVIFCLLVGFRRLLGKPLGVIIFALIAAPLCIYFVQTQFFLDVIYRPQSLSSLSNREFIWDLAMGYIAERPILGYGFGAEEFIYNYHGVSLESLGLRGYGAMSSYYGLVIDVGWYLAALIIGLLWFYAFYLLIAGLKDSKVFLHGAATLVGLLVTIVESSLFSAGSPFAFLFYLNLMLATRCILTKRVYLRAQQSAGAAPITGMIVDR